MFGLLITEDAYADRAAVVQSDCLAECGGNLNCYSECVANACFLPEDLYGSISDYEYKRIGDFGDEEFTGQYVTVAFGALAALLTLVSSCCFCKMSCTDEGIDESQSKISSTLSFMAGLCGAVNILVWNFVSVPDLEDNYTSGFDLVFNEHCFSQIALIAAIFFSLVNACIAMQRREQDWDI